MAFEAVLGIDNDVNCDIAWLSTVPIVTALHPHRRELVARVTWQRGGCTWALATLFDAMSWLACLGDGACPVAAPVAGGGQRVAVRPRASVVAMAASFGGVERRRRNNLSTRILWSVAARMLLALSFSGASCSCFGHRGGGEDIACAGHAPMASTSQ